MTLIPSEKPPISPDEYQLDQSLEISKSLQESAFYPLKRLRGTKYAKDTVNITEELLKQGTRGFDQYVDLDAGNIKRALEAFRGVSPEVASKAQEIARMKKWAIPDVIKNKEEIFEWNEAVSIYNSLFEKDKDGNLKYPYTVAYLSDPGAMMASRDDVDIFKTVEGLVTQFKPLPVQQFKHFVEAFKRGRREELTTLEKIHDVAGRISEKLPIDTIMELMTSIPGIGVPLATERLLGKSGREKVSRAIEAIKEIGPLEPIHYIRPEGKWENFWLDWASNAPQIVQGLATAYLFGNVPIGAISMGARIFGGTYEELKEKGVPEDRAIIGAAAHAIVESALEIPVLYSYMDYLKSAGLKDVGLGFLRTFGTEWLQEYLQEYSDAITSIWAENPDKSLPELFQIFLEQWPEIHKQGAYSGLIALPTSLAGGLISLPVNITKANISRQHVQYWKGLSEAIGISKKAERSPNEIKSYYDRVAKSSGGHKNFYVSLDILTTYFQNDPQGFKKFIADMGIQDQIEDAQITGNDLEIPISNYMTRKYPGTDLDNAIFDDVKLQGGMSRNEQSQLNEEMKKELETAQKDYFKAYRENRLPKQFYQMRQKLMSPRDEGGFGLLAEDADAELKVFLSGATILSKKSGETLDQWFNRINPTIRVGGEYVGETYRTHEKPRGAVSFADGQTLINLYRCADMSTFVHESGHIFFNEMKKLVESGKADSQLQKDFQTLLNFAFKGPKPPTPISAPLSTQVQPPAEREAVERVEKFPIDDYSLASHMYDEIKAGQPGFRKVIEYMTERGEEQKIEGISSSYPEYFKNKGFTKKDALKALKNVLNNKKLGKKQQRIFDSLLEDKKVELIDQAYKQGIDLFAEEKTKAAIEKETTVEPEGEVDTSFDFGANVKTQFQGLKDDDIDFEKIAQAFETYIKEGKAPSPELISTFRRLRNWLTAIYKALQSKQLPEINDEVRGVFDRLLASEEEVEAAAQYYGHKFELDQFLELDEKQKADLADKRAQSKTSALDKQVKKYLRAYNKALEAGNKIKDQAAKAIGEMPIYQAIDETIAAGGLNFDQVFNRYGSEIAQKIASTHKGVLNKEGQTTIEDMAAKHGYDSEDQFINDLQSSLSKKDAIAQKVKDVQNQVEQEIRADLSKQEEIPGEEAIHTDAHMSTMIAEAELLAEALRKKGQRVERPKNVKARAYRDAAEDLLFNKKVKDATRYDLFAKTELKYFKQFEKFMVSGNLAKALEAKEKQILNHALVQAAVRNRDLRQNIERGAKRLGKLNPESYSFPHREAILALLQRYGLGTPNMIPQKPEKVDIAALVEQASEINYPSIIPDWVINMQGGETYRDLQFNEFLSLYDAMTQIKAWGDKRLKAPILSELMRGVIGEQKDITIDEIIERSIAPMAQLKSKAPIDRQKHPLLHYTQDGKRRLISTLSIGPIKAMELDAYQGFGPKGTPGINQKLFSFGLARADSNEKSMWDSRVAPELGKNGKIINGFRLINKRLTKKYGKEFDIPGLPFGVHPELQQKLLLRSKSKWTPSSLIMACFNTGNEKNLNALMGGYGFDKNHINKLRSMLTADEWQTIQDTWDLINSFYKETSEVYFRVNDIAMQKESAMPFTVETADDQIIEMRGGYFPLRYDRDLSIFADKTQEKADLLDQASAIYQHVSPKSGHTMTRKGVTTLPPKLKLSVIYDHLHNVVHYISHEEIIRDLNKITSSQKWRAMFEEKFNIYEYRDFREFLKHVARPQRGPMSYEDIIATRYRKLSTLYFLSYRPKIGVKTTLSFGAGAQEIGWHWASRGAAELLARRGEMIDDIHSKSQYMKNRWRLMNREIQEQLESLEPFAKRLVIKGKEITLQDAKEFGLIFIKLGDEAVTHSIWQGSYEKHLSEHSNLSEMQREKEASAYADDIIGNTQPSSRDMDLAHWQRGQGLRRILSMFMTPTLKYGARTRAQWRGFTEGHIKFKDYARHVANEQILPIMILTAVSGVSIKSIMGDDDDEEPLLNEIGYNLSRHAFSAYPVANGLSFYLKNKYGDVVSSPVFDALNRIHIKTLSEGADFFMGKDAFSGKAAKDLAYALALSIEFEMGIPAIRTYRDIMRALED